MGGFCDGGQRLGVVGAAAAQGGQGAAAVGEQASQSLVAVVVVGVAVDQHHLDLALAQHVLVEVAAQDPAHGLGHLGQQQVGEQGAERVGQQVGEGAAGVHALLVGHLPVVRHLPDRLGQDGDGPGLDDHGLAVGDHPLDVLRAAEEVGDAGAQLGQGEHLPVIDGLPGGLFPAHAHLDGALPLGVADGAGALGDQATLAHLPVAHDEGVGGVAFGGVLPQPQVRGDQRLLTPSGEGVGGEHHAGGLGGCHQLHEDGHPGLGVVELVLATVGDGPVAPQRGIAAAHGGEQLVGAVDVEEAVELAGGAELGQVLDRG
ncbi:hypothetical protein GCM10027030_26280 [Luteococcus sediminum]